MSLVRVGLSSIKARKQRVLSEGVEDTAEWKGVAQTTAAGGGIWRESGRQPTNQTKINRSEMNEGV